MSKELYFETAKSEVQCSLCGPPGNRLARILADQAIPVNEAWPG